MYENWRLIFSLVWLAATGFVFALALAVLFTWGDFLHYLYAALVVWVIASIGAIVTSL